MLIDREGRNMLGLILTLASSATASAQVASAEESSAPAPVAARAAEGEAAPTPAAAFLQGLPLYFEENRGQMVEQARFAARRPGLAVVLADDGFVLEMIEQTPVPPLLLSDDEDASLGGKDALAARGLQRSEVRALPLRFSFIDHAATVKLEGRGLLSGRVSYLRGVDASRWTIGVQTFARVRYLDLYPGIDLEVYDAGGILEYDVIVAPGADLSQLVIDCDGADSLEIDASGALVAHTRLGELKQQAPKTYRRTETGEQVPIHSRFRLIDERRFGFEVEATGTKDTVVIDPGLIYSTFYGAQGFDQGFAIATDSAGAVYITGVTDSTHLPITGEIFPGPNRIPSVSDPIFTSTNDVFVAKFDTTLPPADQLVYAAVFGGSGEDSGNAIEVDTDGAAYVAGQTESADFPVTAGAFQTTYGGTGDAFLLKINPQGTSVEYSTLLGGTSSDFAFGIAIDAAKAAYLTGGATSADFPTTPGAFDTTLSTAPDIFIAKIDATGGVMVYGTFVGSTGFEDGFDIQVNADGEAYVTGRSGSPDFPTTPGVFDETWNGSLDTFVLRLSADGSSIVTNTFVSALRRDEGHALAIDPDGYVYVTGVARSEEFPVTPGAYDTTQNDGYDAFVFKLNPDMSALEYSTFLGGVEHDVGWDIAIDSLGQAYATGVSFSPDFPTTVGSYEPAFGGLSDAYLAKLNPTGSILAYSTYLGRLSSDESVGLVLTGPSQDQAFLVGYTASRFFPVTDDAYDLHWNNNYDIFIARVDPHTSCPASRAEYGSGWPGSSNIIPSLTLTADPVICSDFSLEIGNSFGAPTQAVVFIGLEQATIPTDYGGTLLVVPNILVSLALSAGTTTLPLLYTCDANLCGLTSFLQVLEVDPGASKGISFTPGLQISIGTL